MFHSIWCFALLLLPFLAPAAQAIQCYECDEFRDSYQKKCPGVHLINFGHKHDACVIYRLGSGQIVFQQAVQMSQNDNICTKTPEYLKGIIRRNFGQDGIAMCCRHDGCNKDIPNDFYTSRELFLEDFRRAKNKNANDYKLNENLDEGALRESRDEYFDNNDAASVQFKTLYYCILLTLHVIFSCT